MISTNLIIAFVSYLLGSIPFGYILVKLFLRQDIRQTGSGNIGATNVARSGAKGLAIATLLLDAGKGFLAVEIAGMLPLREYLLYLDCQVSHPAFAPVDCNLVVDHTKLATAALFAVIGHCFPIWLKFKGGKGVATALGAFAALAPKAILVALIVFVLVLAISRFVSAGSVLSALVFPVAAYWLYPALRSPSVIAMILIASAIVILKHHENIRRLLSGTENKFGRARVPTDPIQAEKNA
jgi:acyl phosphate:glycerol-3-phosphate acyltransferase